MDVPQWLVELQREWSKLDENTELPYVWIANLARTAIEDGIDMGPLFARMEDVLVNGTEADGNLVCVGFMEGVLSLYDWDDYDLSADWPLVGRNCREFVLALNEFWGIKSPEWMVA